MRLRGWVELEGRRLSQEELASLLERDPAAVCCFGGEFCLEWDDCLARDCMGIVPGPVQAGRVVCGGRSVCEVRPRVSGMPLEEAIGEAVRLRQPESIIALSGGVDSSLIAALAEAPALVVGFEGCRDHASAREVAKALGVQLEVISIAECLLEEALHEVLCAVPGCTPQYAGIGVTLLLIARASRELGFDSVLVGTGADELFAGYARHLRSTGLEEDLEADLVRLKEQIPRDQAIAGLEKVLLSMPYLDPRVVKAARGMPREEMISAGVRKVPLRRIAARYLGEELAYREKKAMQYGSGVAQALRRLARRRGCRSIGGLIESMSARGC